MSNYAVKMLTERQAWTRIAEAFARFEATGKREELTETGLCGAVLCLGRRDDVGYGVHYSMWRRLGEVMDGNERAYLYPRTRRGAGLRAMLATLFAEDSAV